MAIQIADNFSYQGKKPLDGRVQFNTLADMVATSANVLYDGCLAYVKGNKKYYTYDSTNDVDVTLGKWRELETGTTGDFIPTSEKGANGGVAELDANGKVPASQMPNGFDNVDYGTAGGVVETASGYTATSFTKAGESSPVTPRTDTIYLDTTLNISFMWGGENYISVGGGGVALGETSSTAYRGDRGKTAYDDSQANKTAIGTLANLTTTEKTNLVGAINEIDNALGGKVDAVQGKGLSENDYSDADKAIVDGVTNALADKVDKVSGKGLSTNDYDNTEKQKVADAQPKTLATPITVEGVQQTTVEGALGAINNKSGGGGDVSSKADKVTNATAGNFAGLDATGNLTDSGKKASDFLTQHQDISGKQDVELETPITIGGEEQDTVEEALDALNGAKEDIFRALIMPLATLDDVGKALQYIGTSIPNSYQHNYFYECKAQGTEPETYAWEQVNVQPSSEGDARVKPEITEIGMDEETGTKVHVVSDVPISDINEVSLAELKDIVDAYYADEISLADIKDSFKLGQTIRIDMPALDAATGGEAHVAQPIFMRLVSYDTKPLTTAINGHTKALFTFDMSNTLLENGGWSLYTYEGQNMTSAWASNTRRTWCNDTFYNALPDDIKALLKTVKHSSTHIYSAGDRGYSATDDKIVILSEWEYTGGSSYETEKQCDYYKTVANRIKTKDGVATSYATDTIVYMGTSSWVYANRQINASGNAVNGSGNGTAYPLSMAFFM